LSSDSSVTIATAAAKSSGLPYVRDEFDSDLDQELEDPDTIRVLIVDDLKFNQKALLMQLKASKFMASIPEALHRPVLYEFADDGLQVCFSVLHFLFVMWGLLESYISRSFFFLSLSALAVL
jgi:hypothetical protein